MNEKELSLFIAWLEDQVVECRLLVSSSREDQELQAFYDGELKAYQNVLLHIQTQ